PRRLSAGPRQAAPRPCSVARAIEIHDVCCSLVTGMARWVQSLVLAGTVVASSGVGELPRQLRGPASLRRTCTQGEAVRCPGSDATCAGDQCCPPVASSGNLTFPCPSLEQGSFQGCESGAKVHDCEDPSRSQPLATGACRQGEQVLCPGSGAACAGDACCPPDAASGNRTFPCPSAHSRFGGCESSAKLFYTCAEQAEQGPS
ncbi:unnamed protein product, partial [Prorocentrum cordatum]